MRYRIRHRTTYSYDADVHDSLGVAYLLPRTLPWQTPTSASVTIGPEPSDRSDDTDHYGNCALFFQVTTAHRELVVTGASEVEVVPTAYDLEALAVPWELARPAERADLPVAWRAVDLTLPSPLVEVTQGRVRMRPRPSRPGGPRGGGRRPRAPDLHRLRLRRDGDDGDEHHRRRADQAGGGVPGLRAAGHRRAARERARCPLRQRLPLDGATAGQDRVVGADASHAWLAVWVPGQVGGHWLAVDPTNDVRVGDRHVTVAWGRDYADVPPLKGVIFTDAETSTLTVEVDVEPVA